MNHQTSRETNHEKIIEILIQFQSARRQRTIEPTLTFHAWAAKFNLDQQELRQLFDEVPSTRVDCTFCSNWDKTPPDERFVKSILVTNELYSKEQNDRIIAEHIARSKRCNLGGKCTCGGFAIRQEAHDSEMRRD